MNGDLFPPPAHYTVVERVAAQIERDMAEIVKRAQEEVAERCSRIIAFAHRSLGQRKRWERIRQQQRNV